jgi:hypothetical protein
VTQLALGGDTEKGFGRVRSQKNHAEFEKPGQGVCGLNKIDRQSGSAYLDLLFSGEVALETRDLFISFVDEHLRKEGVKIKEGPSPPSHRARQTCHLELSDAGDNAGAARPANKGEEPVCGRRFVLVGGVLSGEGERQGGASMVRVTLCPWPSVVRAQRGKTWPSCDTRRPSRRYRPASGDGIDGPQIAAELGVPAGSVFQVIGELNRVAKA